MKRLIVMVALAGCAGTDAVAPRLAAAPDTTLAITADSLSLWDVSVFRPGPQAPPVDGELYRRVYLLASGQPDTLYLALPDTLPRIVYGYRLNSRGYAVCHDWREARRGETVSLWCEPT